MALAPSRTLVNSAAMPENVSIDGPAGTLEGILQSPGDSQPAAQAVVCHPHPLHGGTMQNKVVHTLARAFLRRDFRVLRFNFRGVGDSEGEYDEGRGELADTLSAAKWLRQRDPALPLWLAGYSFGAAIAALAAVECNPAGLISIAPALSRFATSMARQPACPWLIVHGDQDELIGIDETIEWMNRLEPGPELTVFPETTHFFHGKLVQLRQVVEDFVLANSCKTRA